MNCSPELAVVSFTVHQLCIQQKIWFFFRTFGADTAEGSKQHYGCDGKGPGNVVSTE